MLYGSVSRRLASLNINQLEYFVATVQCGSFSTAARELFITPQAVSKAVGDLEKELRIQLLQKSGRGVEATQFGTVFAERSAEILSCLLDLEALAKNYTAFEHEKGHLSVAVTASACRGNVITPSDFDAFTSTYPRIDLTLHYGQSGSCLSALEEQVVDAAIIFGRTTKPGIVCVKLLSCSPLVALSCNHPLSHKTSIRLAELETFPIAMPEDLRYCYPALSHHFSSHGLATAFHALPPIPEQHYQFLDGEQGVMFVANDPSLASQYPMAKLVPLEKKDAVHFPLCLAYQATRINSALTNLERYLVSTASRIRKGCR